MIRKSGQTLTHQRPDDAREPGGGRSRAWSTLASSVSCWLQPARASIVQHWAALNTAVTVSVYTTTDLAARADDRLVLSSGQTVLVAGQLDQAGLGKLYRVDGKEIAG